VTSPADSEWFEILDTPSGKVSCWSERHVAFAAGLGTFGLNRAFISEVGTSIVLNSVVIDAIIEPTPHRAESYLANCLHNNGNNCSACIRRCPAGAISENGHNKALCASSGYGAESTELAASYGIKGRAGCALCQSGVPCEATNPSRPQRANEDGHKLAPSG
jgi:epoxyqueuosine reductase